MKETDRKSTKYTDLNKNIKPLDLFEFYETFTPKTAEHSLSKCTDNTYQDRTIYRIIK